MRERDDRMGRTKHVFRRYEYYECDAFAADLEQMALKGWQFEAFEMGLKFVRCKPQALTYAVEVFEKGKETDYLPSEEAKDFAEYCEVAGWKLVDGRRRFCVFQKVREDAVPIRSEEERLEKVGRYTWRAGFSGLINSLLVLLCGLLNWFLNFGDWGFDNLFCALVVFMLFAFLGAGFRLLEGIRIIHRCNKQWRAGDVPYWGRNRLLHPEQPSDFHGSIFWSPVLFATVLLLIAWQGGSPWLWFMLLTLLAGIALAVYCSVKRPSREDSGVLQVLLCIGMLSASLIGRGFLFSIQNAQERALMAEQTKNQETGRIEGVQTEVTTSVLGSRSVYRFSYEENDVACTRYQSSYGWVKELLWRDYNGRKKDCQDVTADWKSTKAVYDAYNEIYCVQDGNRFLYVQCEKALSQKQIAQIRAKLLK